MQRVLDILKLAIEKEHLRQAAYLEAAAATTNALARSTFEALAREEEKHAGYLRAFYDHQVSSAGWPEAGTIVEDEDSLAVAREIFKYANQQITHAASTEGLSDIYEAAIAAEDESIHLYSDAVGHTDDPNVKAFFAALLEGERQHLKILSETQEYLDDPGKWYLDEEHWIVEG